MQTTRMIRMKTYVKLLVFFLSIVGMGRLWAQQAPHTETYHEVTYNVVYLRSGGNGDGSSSSSPVGSWPNAYKKLVNTGNREYDWEHNVIVVVDEMQLNFKENDTKDVSNTPGTPATITGVWPWDQDGKATTDSIIKGGQIKISGTTNNIGADARFKNARIQGDGGLQDRLCLRLHSTCFDEGLIMMGFASLGTQYGMISDRDAPAFHIQMSFDHYDSKIARDTNDVKYRMPDDKRMTVTFKSGRYGRVALSRTQGTNATSVPSCYIQGTPEHPIMANVIVDIQPGNDNTGNYADDIGILLGGSSQGLVCADVQFDIKHGSIGTMVAGTQGNNINQCVISQIPAATFAGRTVVNVGNEDGGSSDVTIQTFYGGTQGRTQTSSSQTNAGSSYFYGQSEFNMYSGTIMAGVFASATAFSGLRYENDHNIHTPDYAIPYVNNSNELSFGSYSESGTMMTLKSTYHNGDEGYVEGQDYLDLAETRLTFNVYGGLIEGGICGGSRGYEPQVTVSYAPDGAGTHYGDTYVNIYGGTIRGGVYGGGLGTKEYYNQSNPHKSGFLSVAQVYGNTHVNIRGGNIEGDIYGGGSGIATDQNEYLDIAHVYGTTTVVVDPIDPSWTFGHNIYGGGALGAVDGDTRVVIKGGIINGNVFGAGKGEEGHPNKAKVSGSTNVIVDENWTE